MGFDSYPSMPLLEKIMKAVLGTLFVALLLAPLAFAHVDQSATVDSVDVAVDASVETSVDAKANFFAAVTPIFLQTTMPSGCSTQLDQGCADICIAKHTACAIAICGQPCFVEPCMSELSDCLNAC